MILSLIVFLPLVGALLVLVGGGSGDRPDREGFVRRLALAVSLLTFAATLVLWWRFDPTSADYQFVERHAWMPAFGIQYLLGVDGISLFLVVLTGFLTPLALLSSWDSVHKNVKMFAFFLLALESSMLGVFVALDLFLFYMFWDFVLIPMYFLIGIWGYERRVYAAVKFILFTMAGSVLMLVAIIGLAWAYAAANGTPSFSLLDLQRLTLSWPMERWFFLAFALAFLIKVPLFPFHTWLPDAHVEAPTAGSVILAGVMLKMGTYGLVRFAFPLFPSAAMHYAMDCGVRGDWHHLRRAGRDGAARSQEARRVFERQPPGVCRARPLRDERAGPPGFDLSDAQPRRQHRRSLHDRRHALGSPAYTVDF